ncbi:MAG: site-specific integrase [Armatimonadetes bacterium]|nr:site-specific integrase [Armatimonadota bacterium]
MKGTIYQRGKDTWLIAVDLGKAANGKRKRLWKTVHGGRREAERELTQLLRERDTHTLAEPNRLTVAEYLGHWLSDYARPNVAPKTWERYEEIVRLHLIPALGGLRLDRLQPLHIQGAYSRWLESGRRDGKGGLASRTILHHHRILREALQQAVRWQLLARNPADAVDPPRPAPQEMAALDEAGTARLLEAARDTWLYVPILLAIATGMRRGEILGLRWQDVDLEKGALSVRQTLEQTQANGLAFKQPKTPKSRRAVALPAVIVQELRRHRGAQAERQLLLGPTYHKSDLVCCHDDGSLIRPSVLSKCFGSLLRRSGLAHVRFHDLRHTHATQLLREGVHVKIVSERLGHSTVGITLDTYSHVLPGMQEDAARRMDTVLRAALGG